MFTPPSPILVTGAAGRVGGVGNRLVTLLLFSHLPVRALVRTDDSRAQRLRSLGAEVVIADLTKTEQILPALQGCRLVFFSTSVSANYLEAAVSMAAAARASPDIELLVNLSQMTVAGMSLTKATESPQQRVQWLSEQVFTWSGIPVAHLRPTIFQENPLFWNPALWGLQGKSVAETGGQIRLPFANSRTNPIAADDVADVALAMLKDPAKYVGRAMMLTGPRSMSMYEHAAAYAAELGRSIEYVPVPMEEWSEGLAKVGLPEHVFGHIATMAKLHAEGEYDRNTDEVEAILGRPGTEMARTVKGFQNEMAVISDGE